MFTIGKEDLEKAVNTGEKVEITMNTAEFSHRPPRKGKIFVHIQLVRPIRGNRWMAKGQAFEGKHDVIIFSGKGQDNLLAKTVKIFRGGLKVSV